MAAAAQRFPIADARAQVARLVPVAGQPGNEFRLLSDRALIGSSADADFVLAAPTVSQRHALVRKRNTRYLLADLASSNGTFINGIRLEVNTERPLSNADDIQIGALHFTFLAPDAFQPVPRRARNRRIYREGFLTLVLMGALIVCYLLPREVWNKLSVHHEPPSMVLSNNWLGQLNQYRQLAGLPPVSEAAALSTGDGNHAHYLVANDAAMIRSGKVDSSIHDEDPGKPFFTPEGKTAGALSDVDAVYTNPPEAADSAWAIEDWITAPFHRMWLLDPALHQIGYGQYCENGVCAAALNVRSGIDADSGTSAPVMYPPPRATIHNGAFSAEQSEWPDPLATCGYQTPTGVPITLEIGALKEATLEQYSLTRNGAVIPTCAFDASSYKSADPVAYERVTRQLAHFAAIVMVPKAPLVPGAAYLVKITASGRTYSWWFAVGPK